MRNEYDLEEEVERQLRKALVKYLREPVVGKTRPDFLVTTDHGDQIVIEVKFWEASPDNMARAMHQAKRYRELSKAAAAIIVTASGESVPFSGGGVVPISGFLAVLSNLTAELAKKRSRKPADTSTSPDKKVFASMPFTSQYDDTFLVAIQPAALVLGAAADRVDHTGRPGDVVQQIKEMIRTAALLVADLSESRANVCHEVGYAEALKIPVVQICSTDLSLLPFNLRNNQTIHYSIGQASRLRARIEKEMAKVL